MIDLALLVGHFVGDFMLQCDWMAANKGNPWPGLRPLWCVDAPLDDREAYRKALEERNKKHAEYPAAIWGWWVGHLACLVHCIVYTMVIWAFSFWWMPAWGLAIVFGTHFVIDRFRLAFRYMQISGQKDFATGKLSPWSVVVIDQTMHFVVLFFVEVWALWLNGWLML